MTPENFVKSLYTFAPTLPQLEQLGIADDDAREIRNAFLPNPKSARKRSEEATNQLDRLLSAYDMSGVEIGPLCFDGSCELLADQSAFAEFDSHLVVRDKASERIYVADRKDLGVVKLPIASSGSEFLDAIAEVARFYARSVLEESLFDDTESILRCVRKAVELSGDAESETFFRRLFGV